MPSRLRVGLFAALLLTLTLGVSSCCPPFCVGPGNDPCAQYIATTNSATAALTETVVRSHTSPGTRYEDQFLARDGSLSSRMPEDVIGFAFKASVGAPSFSGNLPPFTLWGQYLVLQYDVPARQCRSQVNWIIHPEVVFPIGYVFAPRPNTGTLRVFLWTFADPQGAYDISANRAATLEFVSRKFDDAWRSNGGYRWQARGTDLGPVYVSRRLEGSYVVQPGVRSRVFVAADIEFWLDPGEQICTGCTRENPPLIDAGIFRGLSPGAGARERGLYGPDLVISRVR